MPNSATQRATLLPRPGRVYVPLLDLPDLDTVLLEAVVPAVERQAQHDGFVAALGHGLGQDLHNLFRAADFLCRVKATNEENSHGRASFSVPARRAASPRPAPA